MPGSGKDDYGRPRRPERVVPLEPALSILRRNIPLLLCLTAVYALNLEIVFRMNLAQFSLFNDGALLSIVLLLISLFALRRLRRLDKKRQQAARYNLALDIGKSATTPSPAALAPLPANFEIHARLRRNRLSIASAISLLLFGEAGILVYSYGQEILQAVQHGVPFAIAQLEIALNCLILLAMAALPAYWLTRISRQQLVATLEGLTCRRGWQTTSIPWREARLFAIIGGNAQPEQGSVFYELASRYGLIRWPSHTRQRNARHAPAGSILSSSYFIQPALSQDFSLQVQLLNAIICERTGLPLYDLR